MSLKIASRLVLTRFLVWLAVLLTGIGALVFLIDAAEMVRRASEAGQSVLTALLLSISKLPSLLGKVLPFLLLLAALITLYRLARKQELIAFKAAGFSLYQLLLPMMLSAASIGVLYITVLSPLTASLQSHYERLEDSTLAGSAPRASLAGGIWLKQQESDGYSLLHAAKMQGSHLRQMMVLRFDEKGDFLYRLDSPSGLLKNGYWLFDQGWFSVPGKSPQKMNSYRLPTDFTHERLQESFASPETLSFWALPRFIHQLEEAGFPARRHQLYWQTQLASPLLFAALVMLAGAFASRHPRHGKPLWWLTGGILAGFLFYLSSDFIGALGLSGRLPLILAAWAPPLLCALGAASLLSFTEEG